MFGKLEGGFFSHGDETGQQELSTLTADSVNAVTVGLGGESGIGFGARSAPHHETLAQNEVCFVAGNDLAAKYVARVLEELLLGEVGEPTRTAPGENPQTRTSLEKLHAGETAKSATAQAAEDSSDVQSRRTPVTPQALHNCAVSVVRLPLDALSEPEPRFSKKWNRNLWFRAAMWALHTNHWSARRSIQKRYFFRDETVENWQLKNPMLFEAGEAPAESVHAHEAPAAESGAQQSSEEWSSQTPKTHEKIAQGHDLPLARVSQYTLQTAQRRHRRARPLCHTDIALLLGWLDPPNKWKEERRENCEFVKMERGGAKNADGEEVLEECPVGVFSSSISIHDRRVGIIFK